MSPKDNMKRDPDFMIYASKPSPSGADSHEFIFALSFSDKRLTDEVKREHIGMGGGGGGGGAGGARTKKSTFLDAGSLVMLEIALPVENDGAEMFSRRSK